MPILLPLMLMQSTLDAGGISSPYASALPREIVEKKEDEERKRRTESAQFAGPLPLRAENGCLLAVEADPERSAEVARKALSSSARVCASPARARALMPASLAPRG